MRVVVNDFEVESKLWGGRVRCRFRRITSAIATRMSDTLDCFFELRGEDEDDNPHTVTVAVSLAALAKLQQQNGRGLNDQQTVDVAAAYLKEALERGEGSTALLEVHSDSLKELAARLGFLPEVRAL